MDGAKILVVANPYEAGLIARWLQEAGLPEVRTADGSDDTVAAFQQDPGDVVVMTAALETGDSLALVGALRAVHGDLKLVLIGDEKGPVRTALDAMDFGAARFLRRPLVPKALAFAVRSCLGGASTPAPAPRLLGRRSAAGAAPAHEAPRPMGGSAAPPSPPAPAAPPAPSAPAALHTPAPLDARLEAATSDMLTAFIHDVVEHALAAPFEDLDAKETSPEPTAVPPPEEPPPPPAWREPTQILTGPPPPASPPAAEPSRPTPPVAPEAMPSAVTPIAPDEARTGTFARELRQKMSAIEKRLFGGVGGDTQVPAAADDESVADIDLDKIGVDTVPGLGPDELRYGSRGRTPPPGAEPPWDDAGEASTTPGDTARRPAARTALPSVRGDLAVEDVASLVSRLWREAFTGRVGFERDDALKSIYFEEGRPVFATSNLPHDRMGDLLYREGKITREQHARSREIVAETGRRMGEILVEMGFLKRRELLPAVRRHVEDIVYSLFAWDSGTYETAPGDTAEHERIRLATHPTALVVEGIRRKMSLDRLRQRLSPESVIAPLKRDEMMAALGEADLTTDERHAADLFDGRRTLADAVAASKLDETSIYQLAWALVALGLARRLERGRDLTDAGRGAVAPAAAPSLAGAADVAIDRERVLAKHAHVFEADYFAVLGVRRDATSFEIRRAYEAVRKDYALEAFPLEVQRELAEPLKEIAAVLDEAYRVLRDDKVRAQYLANLRE